MTRGMIVSRLVLERVSIYVFGVLCVFGLFVASGTLVAAQESTTDSFEEVQESEASESTDGPATIARASRFTVAPVVITEKGRPRDIVKGSLKLRNSTDRTLTLYADVYDVDPASGPIETSFGTNGDHARSLANWIEITRGVITLTPNEEIEIPYLIHVNLRAEPGTYYAEVVFNEGPNRPDATAEPRSSQAVQVTFEIGEDIVERLNLGAFVAGASIITGGDATFSYALENSGNRPIAPRGMVRIYDRNGKEVGSVPVNQAGETIAPSDTKELAISWPTDGRFGKYKAFLDLSYGMTGSVNDSVYVWVLPMRDLLIGLFLLVLVAGVITYVLHARGAYLKPALAVASPSDPDDAASADDESEPALSSVPPSRGRWHTRQPVAPVTTYAIKKPASDMHAVRLEKEQPVSSSRHVVRLGKR